MPSKRKKMARGFLGCFGIFIALGIVLTPLLYLEEDWRGAHELAAAQKRWQDAGYSLNAADYYPAPVSDDQNLAALPLFQPDPSNDNPKRLLATRLSDATNEEKHGGLLYDAHAKKDLAANVAAAYTKVFPGKELPASSLAQMAELYPFIDDVRAVGATRPQFRINIDFTAYPVWDRPLGLIIHEIRVAKLLSYHAELAMRENQPQVALEDIVISLHIARGVGKEPSLVGGIISLGMTSIAHRVISEGLDKHVWNDAQLATLQDELKRMDALALFQFDMHGEGATFTIPFFAALKADPNTLVLTFSSVGLIRGPDQWEDGGPPRGGDSVAAHLLWYLFSSGWWDMNAARMLDFESREAGTVDPKLRRVDAKLKEQIYAELQVGREWPGGLVPWKVYFEVEASPVAYALTKFAQGQVELDEDRIACGLERYRLAQSTYPPNLEALEPTYIDELPHDVMNGEPFHYRLNSDGTFLLYSVGWNQIDDGGKVSYNQYAPTQIDYKEGDWVWPMFKR